MHVRRYAPVAWFVAFIVVVAAVTACTRQSQQPSPARTTRVSVAYDLGGRGDLALNDMAHAGLSRARKEFGDRLDTRDREPDADGRNRDDLLRALAGDGSGLVFGIGAAYAESILRVAGEFPEVTFVLVDGFIPGLRTDGNISCVRFRAHEGSFLMGAAAALASRTGVIGFIGGVETPPIESYEVGYIAGARYVKPNITILSEYVGTTDEAFHDPVQGKDLGLDQYARGADVIYHAAGTTSIGIFEAAVVKKKLAIGSGADQSLTVKDDQRRRLLTSMMKRVDIALYETISSFVSGQLTGGCRSFGLPEGGVGYAENDFNREMIAGIKPRLEELKAAIIARSIIVPATRAELHAFLRTLPR